MHLFQFCVSNQRLSPAEDAQNKPWRPIPSHRLTVKQADKLRWILLPACLLLSAHYGPLVAAVSAALSIAIYLHNECKLDSHWLGRSVLNAFAYTMFDCGATLVASSDPSGKLPYRTIITILTSFGIIFTTIHAQDFGDEEGDLIEGRRTLPIIAPDASRLSMPVAITAWSMLVALRLFGSGAAPFSVLIVGAGAVVGWRYYYLRSSPKTDKRSYLWYNIWFSMARSSLVVLA